MTYDSTVNVVTSSKISTLDDSYDGDDTGPIRGITYAIAGSAVFWAACFAVWHFIF